MLALAEWDGEDVPVSTPEDDVVARARAIFERLRQGGAADDPAPGGEPSDGGAGNEPAGEAKPQVEAPVEPLAPAAISVLADEVPVVVAPAVEVEAAGPSAPNEPDDGGAQPATPGHGEAEAAEPVVVTAPGVEEHADVSEGEPVLASADEVAAAPEAPAATVAPAAPAAKPTATAASAATAVPDARRNVAPLPVPPSHGLTAPTEPPAANARLPLPRVLAIANQKGGVGKTTTAVNLGAALAELGYRVLVVDLDPQGNATTGLGVNPRNLETSIYDVIMHDTPLEDAVEPTAVRNLFVVPATIDLAGAEIELVPAFSRELKLRKALEAGGEDFDFTLIDCPPSLGLLTVNGLAAAHEVVVPIQCEYYALEGLGQLLRNVSLVQNNLNPGLDVTTIILTMYDARTKLADQVAQEVRNHFGGKVCRNIVPRTVRLSEAPSFGQPIIVFDPSSRGAIAYRELAKEVSGGAPQRVG